MEMKGNSMREHRRRCKGTFVEMERTNRCHHNSFAVVDVCLRALMPNQYSLRMYYIAIVIGGIAANGI